MSAIVREDKKLDELTCKWRLIVILLNLCVWTNGLCTYPLRCWLSQWLIIPTPFLGSVLSSTEDSDLRQQFQHNHDKLCNQCESLHSTLNNVFTAVDEASFTTEDKDEALFLASSATLAIPSWKCHFMRSTHQDQACLDVINALNSGTVFIVNDWAMTFLPQRYRELQTDWFGMQGISWDMSVVYRRIKGVL